MKSFELEKRQTKHSFILITIVTLIIYALLAGIFIFYFELSIENQQSFFIFFSILAITPIVFSFLSLIDNSTYLSAFIIEENSIKFVYKMRNKINVETIEKKDIKEFNLSVNSDIHYRYKNTNKTYNVTLKIWLNNDKNITILNGNESFNKSFTSPRHKIVKAILKNKEDIPNLNFNVDGNDLQTVNSLKYLYNKGENLPLHKAIYYSVISLPPLARIYFCMWIIIVGIILLII